MSKGKLVKIKLLNGGGYYTTMSAVKYPAFVTGTMDGTRWVSVSLKELIHVGRKMYEGDTDDDVLLFHLGNECELVEEVASATTNGLYESAVSNPFILPNSHNYDSTPPIKDEQDKPTLAQRRKNTPVFSGVLNYFPDALRAVAQCSKVGNDQHNPGKPLHWDRSKSGDELDALTRHLFEAGTVDTDGIRHSTKVAWRALANLQKELEDANESSYD